MSNRLTPLILLDRDGVINYDRDDFIKSEDEWQALPGSLEAIARLNRHGYRVVVVSNQSGLARGLFDIDMLTRIHNKLNRHLAQFGGRIDGFFFCPHGPDDHCDCRKPKPGLYLDVARRLRVSLAGVTAVGDRLADCQAAAAAGARPVLVKTGNGQALADSGEVPEDVPVFADLAAVVDDLLAED